MSSGFGYDLLDFKQKLYKEFGINEQIHKYSMGNDYVMLDGDELISIELGRDQRQIVDYMELIERIWKAKNG